MDAVRQRVKELPRMPSEAGSDGAASPDAFWEKRHKSNVALVHRNVPAALHFVERLDAYLAKYEGEISLIT